MRPSLTPLGPSCLLCALVVATSCATAGERRGTDGGALDLDAGAKELSQTLDVGHLAMDATSLPGDAGTCAIGSPCQPIEIPALPYLVEGDTTQAPSQSFDHYSCAAGISEAGGEVVYTFELTARTVVSAGLDDLHGDDIDVDLQLLSDLDPSACLARGNISVTRTLDPGRYFLVVDTWVDSGGVAHPGPYRLEVRAMAIATGDCATDPVDLEMSWRSCATGIDCYEASDPADGQLRRYLRTPTEGPVVKEAHLVTEGESFTSGWPTTFTDQIERHYQRSEASSGYLMSRSEPWAPAGEGGSEFGQGSTGDPVPLEAEAWYLNMYWKNAPAKGTRILVTNPANGQSVVAAGGYETGPGDNGAIGGVTEEIHDYLGTGHHERLRLGFLRDQTLPLGPIACP